MKAYALIGSTGLVGAEIEKQISVASFASHNIDAFDPADYDAVLLATPREVSRRLAPAICPHCPVIDSSSAFRMDPDVPLIIPEINGNLISTDSRIIASPNCVATLLCMAAYPLHKQFGLRRIIGSTYQAASGGGKKLLSKLFTDTATALESHEPTPYGLNCFLHEEYAGEEDKARMETQKILNAQIPISLTAVRVPTLRAHALSLHLTFEEKPSLEAARAALDAMPGLAYLESNPSPKDASCRSDVLCSRLRKDLHDPHALELWVVGDQLLKGASTNVIQILELLRSQAASPQLGGE